MANTNLDPKIDCPSSGADDSADDEHESSRGSIDSSTSQSSFNANSTDGVTHASRIHLPILVQKEMSKLFSARCNATHLDLIPFKVVMDLIREHFIQANKPEILRVLVRLLCQYQPLQGEREYRKLILLCNDLLMSVDDEVRDTFLSMIPSPMGFRQGLPPVNNMVCGHFIRDIGPKEEKINTLTELIKRPLLSYQTMPAPLFQQPFPKMSVNVYSKINNNESHNNYQNYVNYPLTTLGSTIRSNSSIGNSLKSDQQSVGNYFGQSSAASNCWTRCGSSVSSKLPISLPNNSMMWLSDGGGGDSPSTSVVQQSFLPSRIPTSSFVGAQDDLKKQYLVQRKQELLKNINTLTKLKNFQSTLTSIATSALSTDVPANVKSLEPSKSGSFPLTWLTIPTYCSVKQNIDKTSTCNLSRNFHCVTRENKNHFEHGQLSESQMTPELSSSSNSSYYLEQLLKRPETPDCNDPWGNGKKPRKQNKPVTSNNLISRKKKKNRKP